MDHSTNENEVAASKDQDGLQLNDDGQGEEGSSGIILKKGPWTSAEDAMLIDYVKKHGEGNWNAVQKHSGLSRCGKSCRLRWANHLRPNLKKGAFTVEEERLIAELHAKMGNKWARMAAHLPGRTDNEIKNYWNTRVKRRQRAGLPLYPPELCLQAFQEQHGQLNGRIDGVFRGPTVLQKNNYEIPDVMFDGLRTNQGIFHYMPDRSDISTNHLMKSFGPSQYCSIMPSMVPCQKRLRESAFPFIGSINSVKNKFFPFDQFQSGTCHKFTQSYGISSLDPGPTSENSMSFSHSHSNGNSSTSKPAFEAVKLELPSLQYPETDLTSWGTSSNPLPLFESVDAFIQSPPPPSAQELDNSSPRNSGLLDALIYQAKTLSSAKNHSSDKISNSSSTTPHDNADSSTLNMCETEWEDYADPISPFGHSATSFFDECAHFSANRSSVDEENLNAGNIKSEPIDHAGTSDCERHSPSFVNMRPDALLASDWLERNSGCAKNHSLVTDTFASLLGDDLATDYEHMANGTTASSLGWGIGSCSWNNMPAVCRTTDFP